MHIWRCALPSPHGHRSAGCAEALQRRCMRLLPADERLRIATLACGRHGEQRAMQTMAAHALGRSALSWAYVHIEPRDWRLRRTALGQPYIANATVAARPWPAFSLSHTQTRVLCALSLQGRVGIDVESLRRRPQVRRIANRIFAATEQAWLAGLPPAQQRAAFMQLWTAKEAVLKLCGRSVAHLSPSLAFAPACGGGLRFVGKLPGPLAGRQKDLCVTTAFERRGAKAQGHDVLDVNPNVRDAYARAVQAHISYETCCISAVCVPPAGAQAQFIWHDGWPG